MARILLVDDGRGGRSAALTALAHAGAEIIRVESAATALERLAGRPAEGVELVVLTPGELERILSAPGADVMRDAFEVFDDGVCLVASDGALEVANATGARLWGGGMRGELEAAAREVLAGGATADRSLTHEGRAYVARAYPLSGRGAVLYVRDSTDERERELGRLQSEKLASIGLLAAGVAHEINNPAAFVLANIEALTGHMRLVEEKLRELPDGVAARLGLGDVLFEANAILQESKEGMARIHRIVRDLAAFSHADDDATQPIDVNPAVESALAMLRNELKYRARVERDLKATRLVQASAARLGQVFLNLTLNAAQALDEGDPKRNLLRVRSYDRGGDVIVEISDNGPGIAADVLPRIFESFFTTKPRGMGTGLGLPISLGIVRALGGEITVDSQVGAGATFRVRLPATTAGAAEAPAAPPVAAPEGGARRRILAVDDEALLLKAYRRMLGDRHELITALGGQEALHELEADPAFDVVLCDLQMPGMSGMELHAAVRERFPALADRFVFVTGGAFSVEARRFLDTSVAAVINKPFRIEDLLTLVERTASGVPGKRPGAPSAPIARLP
jgi:signal transduction histidine kinase/ActR/RegA family two-component response regulator